MTKAGILKAAPAGYGRVVF